MVVKRKRGASSRDPAPEAARSMRKGNPGKSFQRSGEKAGARATRGAGGKRGKKPIPEPEPESEASDEELDVDQESEDEDEDAMDESGDSGDEGEEEESEEEEEEGGEESEDEAHAKQSLEMFADFEGDDDDEELDFEREARELDEEEARVQEEADEDLREEIAGAERFHLPGPGEPTELPPSALKERIQDLVHVLQDFKNRREPGRARSEYVNQLAEDLCEYYGYIRELADHFLDMFSPAECVEFMEASDQPRPLVIRTNTLKTRRKDLAQALIKRGVHLDPLASWSKVGLKIIESQVPIGATPEYLGGHYMIQAASSMCAVMALAPEPGERVLDLASAPGGKTSYMAQLMKNKGTIIANDLKRERLKSTVANLHRLGVQNTVVCCHNGKDFPKVMGGFDRVLLDAPCSGLGVIARDQSIKIQRTMKDVLRMAHLQRELVSC